jgi:hypothetical protein
LAENLLKKVDKPLDMDSFNKEGNFEIDMHNFSDFKE